MNQDFFRYPKRQKELLKAWDSADELILEHLGDVKDKRVLIVNDQFGALSCSIEDAGSSKMYKDMTCYTDSYMSCRGIVLNSQECIIPITDLSNLSGIYDLVLIKIPKNMSFFEDILLNLTKHLNAESKIICGYMVKYQSKTSFELLEKIIGKTKTSLAKKKARLIFSKFEKSKQESHYPFSVELDTFDIPFIHHSNLFSREKLDIGTRFLLEHIEEGEFNQILDLGCGNGVLGIRAKQLNPSAEIIFTDESKMAIESAKVNFKRYFKDSKADFLWGNCAEKQESDSIDLVLCNPPFHQGSQVSKTLALDMFQDAYRVLKKGGVLKVVGNSHLGYQLTLSRIFGDAQITASNQKFNIIEVVK